VITSVASLVTRFVVAALMTVFATSAWAQGTGKIELSMIPNVGAARIDAPIHWEIMNYARDAQGRRWVVDEGTGAVRTFTLPEGTYAVRGSYSGIVVNHTVQVKAGTTYNYVLNLYATWVRLVAVGDESGRTFQDTVSWQVYRAKDAAEGKPPIATANEAQPRLLLREGKYVIKARQGPFAGQAEVSVAPGESREIRVRMAGPSA
jgi:hypothetical protein